MKIAYEDFTNFVDRIVAVDNVRDKNRQQKNVAFVLSEDSMTVSFGDGVNNIHQVVPISEYVAEDTYDVEDADKLVAAKDFDVGQKVVINLDRLKEIANLFKPTGKTKTSAITVLKEIKDNATVPNSLVFKCMKYIEVEAQNGEAAEGEDSGNIEVVGTFEQAIRWDDVGASVRNAIYQRISIDDVINQPDDVNKDVWDVGEFKDLISKLSADNNRLTLLSAARSLGYVGNVSYSLMIGLGEDSFTNTLVLSKGVDDQLCAILGKMKGNIIITASEEQSMCKIYNEDKTLAMSFGTSKADQNYVLGMNRVSNMTFTGIQCTMYTDAVKDIVNNLISILSSKGDSSVNAEIVIDENGSAKLLFNNVQSQTGSHKNNFSVSIPSYRRKDDSLTDVKLKLPMASIQKIVSNIKSDFVTFDIEFSGEGYDNMTLRIAEINADDQRKVVEQAVEKYIADHNIEPGTTVVPSDVLTNDDMMILRKKALGLTGFVSVKSK